jgi:tetratricopeptide (TPR) repeat protein
MRMAISEIEKLERRFADNPQGLTFAPLAEAYRKSGDPQRALGILVQGLELHPDYIPASIVRGRCHLDVADDPAAEAAFRHVLGLDPENVIALKALADLAERGARPAEAAAFLRQLLLVDRSNEDAREQLGRMEEAAVAAALAAPAEPVVEAAPADLDAGSSDQPVPPFQPVEELESMEVLLDETPDEPLVRPSPEGPSLHEEATLAVGFFNEPLIRQPDTEAIVVPPLAIDLPVVAEEAEPALPIEPPAVDELLSSDMVGDFGVVQLGAGESIELEGSQHNEFQIASAADDLAGSSLLGSPAGAASEFQLPDASADFVAGAIGGSEQNEFQSPDASESLLAAIDGQQPPDASESLLAAIGEAPLPDEPGVEPVPASDALVTIDDGLLSAVVFDAPVVDVTVVEEVAEPADEEPAGQWRTWSDAALAADAEPFVDLPEPEEVAPAVAPPEPLVTASMVEPAVALEPLEAVAPEPGAPVEPPVAVTADQSPVQADVQPDLVVTESMAEIFERQGHAAEALRIYRALAERRPGDARLVARIAELEGREAAASEPMARFSARVTGGTSVRELMRTILGTRRAGVTRSAAPDPAPRPAGGEAAPTRPAPDHLTLSAVFGDEGPPLPPAFRGARATPTESGSSFDEFYGTGGSGAGGRTTRSAHPGTDDLDQFHSWLQNLKR